MTFAPADRAFYDADSHITELPDFLRDHADPAIREQIPQVSDAASLVTDEEVELIVANGNRHTAEHVEAQIVLGDQLIAQSKEIQALGAFDRDDRSVALDMLGFRKQLDPRWANTGRPAARDWMGGGEKIRSKDMAVLHQGPETFISVMVMDGVFEQHPELRGASVELGAGWVPSMLTRLDWVVRSWSKVEDVGGLIDQSSDDSYLFSSDYPHVEGGKDPIGRFETSLGERPADVRDNFYAENLLRIFPDARVH